MSPTRDTDPGAGTDPAAPLAGAAAPTAAPPRACGNCGTPLLGPHCYACGQPVSGLVRHFSSIFGDFIDSVLNIDSRTLRTLGPLLLRPGYLTREYFAGRRVRYVTPVRLFVFLSILTFVLAQWSTGSIDATDGVLQFDSGQTDGDASGDAIARAATIADVVRIRDDALTELDQASRDAAGVPGLGIGLDAARRAVRRAADRRIETLRQHAAASAATATTPTTDDAAAPAPPTPPATTVAAETRDDDDPAFSDGSFQFNGRPWHAVDNPVTLDWLPDAGNRQLNAAIGRASRNLRRVGDDQTAIKDAFLGALPQTLFVLLPVFALLLKLAYLFKRRLYMEHLIVALHSHAFLCLALTLAMLVTAVQGWLAPKPGALATLFGWTEAALIVWMPLYLLLMQKRVYGQGWPMTLIKYALLGIAYTILLSVGALGALLASLIWM